MFWTQGPGFCGDGWMKRPVQDIAVTYRKDYQAPNFQIDRIHLDFDLFEKNSRVRARMELRRVGEGALRLVGTDLKLLSLAVDGEEWGRDRFHLGKEELVLESVPDSFVLETEVEIQPQENLTLSGLYKSSGNFCTQCEAEGFRRITYHPDRPDVLSRFTTTIRADQAKYPILLSNGNPIEKGELEGGRHFVTWEDPFPKPSYLFALVAGDLKCHEGVFSTMSGREVKLQIWVEPQNIDRCAHALESLKKAMKWDEETFGREYDLDIYMIVAVNDFNMGAMENKGLNIFNSKYVLANPETATDDDYENIEGIIAHEYFHNWTGNRVTCRDWFQLTLKEGLTVYRDQEFSSDMTSRPVKRIDDVRVLRTAQFPEDAGPMAHPIRPESYASIDNFYTSTVYNKGAEVIRIYETYLGKEGFRKGMDLYFERHDGQAVTCDDFRAAMADANGVDLSMLSRWYEQAGTPVVKAQGAYDPGEGTYTLTLSQSCPPTPGQKDKKPFPIPIRMGLLGKEGRALALRLKGEEGDVPTERVLDLREKEQEFVFVGIEEEPIPSLLRGFSAPVTLEIERSRADAAFLMGHDPDSFNRWDAGQQLAKELILEMVKKPREEWSLDPDFAGAWGKILEDGSLDGSFRAFALGIPSLRVLGQAMEIVDIDGLHGARTFVRKELANSFEAELFQVYGLNAPKGPYTNDRPSINARRMANACLAYMMEVKGDQEEFRTLLFRRFKEADNMTDAISSLALLTKIGGKERDEALQTFYERWKGDPNVLDKWFQVQAIADVEDSVERVQSLIQHPDFHFTNPNRVRSVVGAFAAGNLPHFHRRDGAGYKLLADVILEVDPNNPQLGAGLSKIFNSWKRYDSERQALMKAQLERIAASKPSKNTAEVVGRALNA